MQYTVYIDATVVVLKNNEKFTTIRQILWSNSMENKTPEPKTMTQADLEAFELKIREEATATATADLKQTILDAEAKAGKTEKDKLYSTLNKKDELNKALKEKLAGYEIVDAEKVKQAEEEERAKLDANDRIKLLEDQNLKIAEESKGLLLEVRESFNNELLKRDLEVYRQKVLAANTGEIIPDMVLGKTKEDIDNAVIVSKTRFQELFKAQQQKEDNDKLGNGYLPQTPDNNKLPNETNPDGGGKNVWEMNKDEFAKYSEAQLSGW